MKNTATDFWEQLKQKRSRRRKMTAILVCLSLIVAGSTAWAFHMTGESQTAETYCGFEEHQHDESCVEKVLVCGYDTEETTAAEPEQEPKPESGQGDAEPAGSGTEISGHVHSDECYETQTVLTCTETEHTHSEEDGCYDEEGNLICEIPEHTHSEEDDCYDTERKLICGLEEGSTGSDTTEAAAEETGVDTETAADEAEAAAEAGHIHTDECYETTYICGYDYEHTHTLSCFSNPDADVETAKDWEKTFADVELTGVYADDVLAIAKTQLGYQESTKNYATATGEDGEEYITGGYTRYGAWYGKPYADWDALFVSFCLNYADVPEETFPRDADCESLVKTLSDPEKGYELYEAAKDNSPYPGDLVFFDTDEDEKADHVGIVSELTPEYAGTEESYKDDADYTLTGFHAIEGDSEDKVKENEYDLTDETILGYGRLPENPDLAGEEAGNEPDGEEAGDETRTITADAGDGVTVTAVGRIPEGACLTVRKLEKDQIAYIGERFADISLGKENFAYDIKICDAEGEELELGQDIRITISGLKIADDAEINGYHLVDVDADSLTNAGTGNTAVEKLDVSSEEGGITFITDSFSVMLFTADESDAEIGNIQINNFSVVFSDGGKLTDTDGDETKDYYVWTATDSASGHEFVYRVDYTISGEGTIPAGKFVVTLPLHMLKDEDGDWADSFDCAYLSEDEVAAGDSPDFVYRIDEKNNCVYIYNYSEIEAGQSGYIEFSYTTTEQTYDYEDLGDQTNTLVAKLDIGTPVDKLVNGETEEPNKHAEAYAQGINIDTSVAIISTAKQTPTRYTSWQASWGNAPDNADDYYYFVWPIYTVVGKGTQRYDLTLTDTFSDFGGEVVAYRFSGSSEWVEPDENGSATVEGLTPTDTTGRYDYVLVSCSKKEILSYLKNQYPEFEALQSATSLEAAERLLYESGEYTMSYTVNNQVKATVAPEDGKDNPTSASASKSYTYEVKPYESPDGIYYADKWGIYHTSSRVYSSEDISSYELSEFLNGKNVSIDGLKYYTYVHGYPGNATLEDDAEGSLEDAIAGKFFKKSVTYSLADKDFSLRALTYENTDSSGMSISGVEQALDTGDYDVTSLEWSMTAQTAVYDKDKMGFVSSTIRDFSEVTYEPETGFEKNTLYFYVYVIDDETSEGEWLLAATYNLATGEYTTYGDDYPGAEYINTDNLTASGASGTIHFKEGVKGYKIEMSNPFYYTKIGAYPTISLKRTGHVAQILLGNEAATVDDLNNLDENLTKIAVTNKSTGTISQNGNKLYERAASGTDYASGVVRNATLSKRITSTLNNKRARQYEITWSVTLKETYTDETGDHAVPQESGIFYDLLPAGAIPDLSTVKVTSSSGTLNAGEYDIEEIENYNGTGRIMLKVTIHEATNTSYILTYTTSHSWDAIKDYGKNILNSVAYETGNEDIGDGGPDNGGNISERELMGNLTETENDDEGTNTEKFLFAETSWDINNLLAANTGLMKLVKASGDAQYSYSTTVSAGGTYSYQIRFANDSLTVSEDIMLFDSLEYFHQTESQDAAIPSDWEGTLIGIDCSQLDVKFTDGYTVYVSEVDNLNFYQLNGTTEESGDAGKLDEDYVFTDDTTAKWVKLTEYQKENADLSKVRAVAIDARGNRLAAGDSVTYTLYMKAPATASDEDYDYDDTAKNDNPYPDPITYNNIFVSRTALQVVVDKETGDSKVDEDNAAENFFHQDYTQVRFRPVGDVLLLKVNRNDTTERVSGATYLLSGTSDYGTVYELIVTSDKNGLISFTDVETGTYTLKEISCGSDWQLNKEVYTVTIKTAEDGSVVTTLSGYDYPDSDENGSWDTEEVSGKTRHLLTDEPRIHGDLSFEKTDSITGGDIEGAEFKLYGTSYYGNDILMYAASDSSGEVTFADVELGSYTMVETSTADGYILSGTVWTVDVDEDGVARIYVKKDDGTTVSVGNELENEPYHTVQFLKKSTYGISNYIEGITFKLYGTSDYGNYYEKEAVSSEYYGLVTFDKLEPGVYNLVEVDTSNAEDNSYDEDERTNGLSYPVDSHVYTVQVNADGTYIINGLSTEKISITNDEDGENEEDFYVFENTPENGVITVKKIWLDNVDNSDREPTDIDITISSDEPDAASFGGTSITFNANGGSFEYYGGSESYKLAYAESNEEMKVFGRGKYVEPYLEDGTFEGWYTDEDCTNPVTVNEIGYPVDSNKDLITPTTEGQSIWMATDNGGNTLTLYAKYITINMKYAVRLYGIQADKDAAGNKLGLTFGPATGESYLNLKSDMTGDETASYGSGSGYVAHLSKADYQSGEGVCLHWMTWEEIAEQSEKDPTAFNECLAAGCTHSVNVSLNNKLLNTSFKTNVAEWTGDGAGMFYNSINSNYRNWNKRYTYGGWAISRIRYTLNGAKSDDAKNVSGTEYLCDISNSLLSCFESGLQKSVAAALKLSNTGLDDGENDYYNEDGETTCDKLWLFDTGELCNSDIGLVKNANYEQYTWMKNKYSPNNNNKDLINYNEDGEGKEWWMRSASLRYLQDGVAYCITKVGKLNEGMTTNVNGVYGVAPSFCIK